MLEILGILFIFYWICGCFDNQPTEKKEKLYKKKDESTKVDDPSFYRPYRSRYR